MLPILISAAHQPSNVRVSQKDQNSVLVSWTYLSSWPQVTSYYISYNEVHSVSVTATKDDNEAIISGLVVGVTYYITVVANSSTLPSIATTATVTLCKFGSLLYDFCFILMYAAVHISLTYSPSSIVAGDSATLTCSLTPTSGVSVTPYFKWEGPGVNETSGSKSMPSQLILNDFLTSHAGVYICSATYEQGNFSTNTSLTVQGK